MSATPRPVEDRLIYSRDELLASGAYDEPLIAGGVRCHGGFEADGRYGSPRTLHRAPGDRGLAGAARARGRAAPRHRRAR